MALDRRGFLAACSQTGIASALLPGVLYTLAAQAQETKMPAEPFHVTEEMLDHAAALAGVQLSADQKKMMLEGLEQQRESYEEIRKLKQELEIPFARMLFVGDALFPGGNDHPARSTGVECIEVRDPKETERVIKAFIAASP